MPADPTDDLPHLGRRGAAIGCRRRRPPNRPARRRWRPAGRRVSELGRCRPPPSPLATRCGGDRFRRGQLIHALLQHLPACPPRRAGGGAALSRPARPWPAAGEAEQHRGRGAGGPGPPGPRAAVRPGGPRRGAADGRGGRRGGRRAGGPAGGAARPRAGRRLQDQPRAAGRRRGHAACCICARWPPIAPCCARSSRAAPLRCALVWTRAARVMPLPDDTAGPHAPGHEPSRLIRPPLTPLSANATAKVLAMSENTKPVTDDSFATDVLKPQGARCWSISGRSGAAPAR